MARDLKNILAAGSYWQDDLKYLLTVKPSVAEITPLLSKVVDAAVDSSHPITIGLTREILSHLKNEPSIRSGIRTFVESYLAGNDEWHYRRIAELYKVLAYEEELNCFLALCRASDNWEIREIFDDYHSHA